MDVLPLFHRLTGQRCVVIGGGVVAARKIRWLVKVKASVIVVAPWVCDEVAGMASDGLVQCIEESFVAQHLDGAVLVIAATNDEEVNAEVSDNAKRRNLLVNVVDNGELSNVIFPSIVDRDPVTIAISTSGEAPTLARMLRGRLEALLSKDLGGLALFLGAKRRQLRAQGEQPPRAFWEAIVAAGPEHAEATFDRLRAEGGSSEVGQVAIVGAGPGDPELLTLKALQVMQSADLVLYDNLVSPDVLEYARRDAERRYVGKKRAVEGSRQEDINQQMFEAASQGLNVVRLKGGDPFIFGRGGEEIATLAGRGIPCTVVPGITAALGAASYAGIPLTYRNVSLSVRFITGHLSRGSIDLDWQSLARPDQTLVFYMGLFKLKEIAQGLKSGGMSADTPVALVENATLANQRVVEGTLADIALKSEEVGITGPTAVIVGEVVRFRTA